MTWWCSAIKDQWSWSFRSYPGIWLMMAVLVGAYVAGWLRHRRSNPGPLDSAEKRGLWWFGLGALALWVATDWPMGTLGSAYLASVHMLQYMIYTLVAAPLLLLGTPEWMARALVERLHLQGALRVLSKPVVAGVVFNLVLIATHAPWTVDAFRSSQFGSMVLDLTWVVSGLILWIPIVSPLRELRSPSPAVKCVYLFLAAGVIPMIPGGFLTFSSLPLYATYELAPRVGGLAATDDQQMAGILMKIGNIPIVWGVIFVIFAKWAFADRDPVSARPKSVPDAPRGPASTSSGNGSTSLADRAARASLN